MSTTKPKQRKADPKPKHAEATKPAEVNRPKRGELHETMRPLSVRPTPEEERSQLQDPRTSTSSGDPPAALTPAGERLGSRIGDPMLEAHQGHSVPTRGPEGPKDEDADPKT